MVSMKAYRCLREECGKFNLEMLPSIPKFNLLCKIVNIFFKVNGLAVAYNTTYYGERQGILTGVLQHGTEISIDLRNTQNAGITFVEIPEPCTLLLLGLGGLLIRKR